MKNIEAFFLFIPKMIKTKRFGEAGYRSQYLLQFSRVAKQALYHLSYIPLSQLVRYDI